MSQPETSTVWSTVPQRLKELAHDQKLDWKYGQDRSLHWMAKRLSRQNGVLIADEPGMGKTRLALATVYAVLEAGGTAAVVAPPGLLRQWDAEWSKLKDHFGRVNKSVLLRSYKSLFESADRSFPLTNDGWLLLSQRFGVPVIMNGERNKAQKATYVLPFFVSALVRDMDGQHRGNAHWQCVKQELFDDDDCIATQCEKCTGDEQSKCHTEYGWHIAVNRAAHFLAAHEDASFRSGLGQLPERGITDSLEEVREWFESKEGGLRAIGKLLGSVDLLIVDEAHKARGGDTRLSTLVESIIDVKKGGKRIALTATPMELDPSQWQTLFGRIGESEHYEDVKQKIENFDRARKQCRTNPGSPDAIESICSGCEGFANAMRPYMSRRLRRKQDDFQSLVGQGDCDRLAHPHHEWTPVTVDWDSATKEWQPSLFALEALGKAVKGLPRPDACEDKDLKPVLSKLQPWRSADIRYAAGHRATGGRAQLAEKEDSEHTSDIAGVIAAIDKYLRSDAAAASAFSGKLKRTLYWLRLIDSSRADLTTHPRIRKAADEIEKIVWATEHKKREKVLVFGTFVQPLEALYTLLNRRAILRLLDEACRDERGKRAALVPSESIDLRDESAREALWNEYNRLRSKLRVEFNAPRDLDTAVKQAIEEYEKRRSSFGRVINEQFVQTLPGDAAMEEVDIKKVAEWLRTELMNRRLFQGVADHTGDNDTNRDEIRREAFDIWCEFIHGFVDAEEQSDATGRKKSKTEWTAPDYLLPGDKNRRGAEQLDALADHVNFSQIQAELDEDSGRRGTFARLLRGDVRMEARHNLQAKFNRRNAFPFVLVAQSQVGREGLNLHESCRTVVQLHPEWNPGVVEQQVGRVDRIGSYWQELAEEWKKDHGNMGVMPKIRVIPIVFKGTYDQFQFEVLEHRRQTLNAHLFGEILDEETLQRVPEELQKQIREAAPDFEPPPSDAPSGADVESSARAGGVPARAAMAGATRC